MNETNASTHPLVRWFARLVGFLCTFYLVALVIYLVARLLIGASVWWVALLNAYVIYVFMPAFALAALAAITNQWRHALRLGVVCLISIFWFGQFFQAKQAPLPRGGDVLRVVTLTLDDADIPDDALGWLVGSGADLILLQNAPPDFDDVLEGVGFMLPYRYDHGDGRLLLSAYAIAGDDGRVILTIDDEQQVAVYNVMFDAPFDNESRLPALDGVPLLNMALRYDENERNREIRELIETLRAESLPFIVGGNFNMSQHAIIYSQLALVMRDSFRETNYGLGATWPAHRPTLRVNYIWYSRNLRGLSTVIGPDVGLVHLPFLASVEIPRSPLR